MHGTTQSWQMTIIGFVMAMIAVLFGLAVFTENNQQLTANQAVNAALYDSEVKGDATSKGLFVIDKRTFERDVKNSNVATWRKINKTYSKNGDNVQIMFYYLPETNKYAQNYAALNKDNKEYKNYVPIKAVKVLVVHNQAMSKSDAESKVEAERKNKKAPHKLSIAEKGGKYYLATPLDVVTYVANVRVNDRSDDVYLYQTSDDYKQGKKGDPYYENNNDLENKDQQNTLASKKHMKETN